MKRSSGKLGIAGVSAENFGNVTPAQRTKKDDGYAARRAAADAEQAPIVRELVREWQRESQRWWDGLTKQQQREECRE